MNELDLKSLAIFRTVVQEGSISKAAERLNRVQSNVSTRIKQLEATLEKQLFLRVGRNLHLTSEGEILLAYADRLLNLSDEAVDALSQNTPSGLIRIGAMESTASARLPNLLNLYNKKYPDVHVELSTGTAAALVNKLERGAVDVIFIAEPMVDTRFETKVCFDEALVLITPNSYPNLSEFSQLKNKTLIGFEIGCAYRAYLENWLKSEKIATKGSLAVSSYLAIFACVAAGTGFAVAPQSVLDLVATSSQFQQSKLSGKLASIKTLMVWNKKLKSQNFSALYNLMASENSIQAVTQ